MKRKIFLFISLFIVSFLLTSCSKTSREDERSNETGMNEESMNEENVFWTSDRDYTFEEKDQFKQDVDKAVSKLNEEIQNLQQEADQATAETKKMYNERIAELKTNRDHLNSQMKDFTSLTEENWGNFKGDIISTWDDIENSYDQMARDIDHSKDKVY